LQDKKAEIKFQAMMTKKDNLEAAEKLVHGGYRNFQLYFKIIKPLVNKTA